MRETVLIVNENANARIIAWPLTLLHVCLVTDHGGAVLITADHGNAEELLDLKTGGINTEHSASKVPLIIYHHNDHQFKLQNGKLGDIAPTILKMMDVEKPKDMTGVSLL